MNNIFGQLAYYFQFPFVIYAFIVGILISLCSSLFGVTLVLRRFSFIGDGLSHVAFGAMAIASVAGLINKMFVVFPIIIVCAILLLKTSQNTKIKGDASITILSVGALSVGYLLMNIFPSSSNISADVCTTLFGSTSILSLTLSELIFCIIFSILTIGLFVFFYNKIFALTFDENFAKVVGVKSKLYNFLMAFIIAVVVVLAMKLVGSLLISALIVFPSLSAMRIFKDFRSVTIFSSIFSVVSFIIGFFISIVFSTPVGATIVCVELLFFIIASVFANINAR